MLGWLAAAQAADTFDSSALLAMGRVGVATRNENVAITLNPGMLGLLERYDVQGQYRYGPDGSQLWGVSAVDAQTSDKLAGGLSYCGDVSNPALADADLPGWVVPDTEVPNRKRFHDFSLGVGRPFADRRLSIGVGANFGYFLHDQQGPGWILDGYAGLGAHPIDALTLGLSARNFLPLSSGGQDRPPALAAGARVDPKGLPSVEFDATFLPTLDVALPLDLAAGAEVFAGVLAVRGGWRREAATSVNAATIGLGIGNQGASLEYAALVPLAGKFDLGTTVHQIGLRFDTPDPIPEPD